MDFSAIGKQFGLSEEQTRAAIEALTPVVAAGVRRSAQSPSGLQDIFRSVLTGGFDSALRDPDAVSFDNAKPAGDDILGQIFGSKDVSRGVAQQLSATSGIGAAILKKLLPIVATMVIGQLAKNFGAGAARAEPVPDSSSPQGGGLGDILKDIFGGGAASPPARRPAPLPADEPGSPSQGGGLEDILNDILKGGGGNGRVVMKQIPPDQMGDILKEIFGRGAGAGQAQEEGPSPDAIRRGRRTIDDATGGGTPSGNIADDLLNSVEKAIRRGG